MIELREADARDVPAIREVVRQAYSVYIPRMGRAPGPMLDDYEQLVRDGQVRVVERTGEVVGLLVLIPEPGHCFSTTWPFIRRRRARGSGVSCWRRLSGSHARLDMTLSASTRTRR